MIGVDDQHAVERRLGQPRIVRRADDRLDVGHPLPSCGVRELGEDPGIDVLREHPPGRPDPRAQAEREEASACTDVRDPASLLDLQRGEDRIDPLPAVPLGRGDLGTDGQWGERDQERRERAEERDRTGAAVAQRHGASRSGWRMRTVSTS